MTDNQMKTYSTNCRIEYSQEYLPSRDITLIFEETFVIGENVNEQPEEFCVRERITGFYHGEPDEDGFKNFYSKGCEAVMDDELMGALDKSFNIGQWLKDNGVTDEYAPKSKFTYSVIVYGGFDETPLIRYHRTYDDKDQATTTYYELEDTFRLEHKIFDNNTEEFINQKDCSAMAIIRSGAFDDDRVVYFKSLVDNTNYEDYTEDFNLIVKYFQEHNMMS